MAPAPTVSVAEVVARPLRDCEEFTGRHEPVTTVQIQPRVGGFIESAQFAEGAQVKKGQVLFRIDPRPARMLIGFGCGKSDRPRQRRHATRVADGPLPRRPGGKAKPLAHRRRRRGICALHPTPRPLRARNGICTPN
ncbi:MAG: biotin/lipoyl-binding protein [Proteobacteria bacterium]|nr:biotin/lipoyl-binding protein [Pseudomonadota bacterium]